METILVGTLIAAAWLYNIAMWFKGFYLTFAALRIKKNASTLDNIGTAVDNLSNAFRHFILTMGDIGTVGLVRYLIGSTISSNLPAALISVAISFAIQQGRKGKLNKFFNPEDI